MKTTVLIEALDLSEAQINIDNRTVRQRLIVAGQSKNKRLYQEAVLQQAASLFEGRQTYANHPSKDELRNRPERSVRELTGWLESVTYDSGALWATRHFTRNQAGQDTWALVQDIVEGKAPATLLGASINAVGKARKADDGDYLIVESIDAVNSVDDVTAPAAGGGWERLIASDSDTITTDLLNALTFEEWFESRPDYVKRVQNEMKAVRQDEAVKAAKAEADGLREALQAAQAQLETLHAEREAALRESEGKARELALEKAFRAAMLPAASEQDLRKRLLEAAPDEWKAIIQAKRDELKALGLNRVNVTGAGQRVSTPAHVRATGNPIVEQRQRLANVSSPEELQRLIEGR